MYHAYSCDSTFSSAEATNALLDDGKLVCPIYPPVNSHRPCQMVAWKKFGRLVSTQSWPFSDSSGPGALGHHRPWAVRCVKRGAHGAAVAEALALPENQGMGQLAGRCLTSQNQVPRGDEWCTAWWLSPWALPLWKNHGVKVSWDDDIPNILMEKWKNHVPNHQPVYDDSCWL